MEEGEPSQPEPVDISTAVPQSHPHGAVAAVPSGGTDLHVTMSTPIVTQPLIEGCAWGRDLGRVPQRLPPVVVAALEIATAGGTAQGIVTTLLAGRCPVPACPPAGRSRNASEGAEGQGEAAVGSAASAARVTALPRIKSVTPPARLNPYWSGSATNVFR